MPLLRKSSGMSTKRLQHQLYLARECPEPVFDISSCELNQIPSSVFSLCKVLRKEASMNVHQIALIIHSNSLTSLKGAGSFSDLAELRIFDLHNNRLKSLSDFDFIPLYKLQVLNLENNHLRTIPGSIGNLVALQTLNLRGNEITSIPPEVGKFAALRSLDISKNRVTALPKQLCHIKTLESLVLDSSQMKYPSAKAGETYTAPSASLLPVLSTPAPTVKRSRSFSEEHSAFSNTLMKYESLKELQRQQRLMLERQLIEDQHQQTAMAMKAANDKNHLVQFVAKEHARFDQELLAAQQAKDSEHGRMVKSLAEAERQECDLVTRLLEMNEKARKTEELLEQMEKERMEVEQWYIVRQEELEMIRRKDVLASMEMMFEQNDLLGCCIQQYLNLQDDVTKRTRCLMSETDGNVENLLNAKHDQRQLMIQKIMKEEKLQKEAFEALQCQKDARHQRVTSQILLIEQQLHELTLLEIEQRQMRVDSQMNMLAEKRIQLTILLVQLLEEKDKREKELRARLVEMEERKLATQTDYWLVQYQRLLDSKPEALIDQETQLELDVIKILEKAGASSYVPQFARHRISIETLQQMSHDDLSKIGVHEFGLRDAILREINDFIEKNGVFMTKGGPEESTEQRQPLTRPRFASAPPSVGDDTAITATSMQQVTARGIHSECIICQDAEATVLFLNCGHVCSCVKCSDLVQQCPLDRSEIVTKIRLFLPSEDVGSDVV